MEKTAAELAAEKAAADAARAQALITKSVTEANAPLLKATEALIESVNKLVGAVATGPQKSATGHMRDVPTGAVQFSDSVKVGKDAVDGTGIRATRVFLAHAAHQLKSKQAPTEAELLSVLESRGYRQEAHVVKSHLDMRVSNDPVQRALSQGSFADGGALVPVEFSSELVALLRNATAIRQLGARALTMGAALEWPTQEAAATATYVGETTAITPSSPTLGGGRMTEKKLSALVVLSNDLIRNASISAEEFVRDDLVNVIRLKEDYQALYGVGSEYSPRGLVNQTFAANQVNATASSQPAPTLAELRTELGKCVQRIMEGNIPMLAMGWVFSPRSWRYLWSITDGNGNAVYQQEMNTGKLLGHPFIVTNQVTNSDTWTVDGSTDVSRIFFGDFAQFIIGESMGLALEFFPNAAYDNSGTVVSGISKDQSVMRGLLKHDFHLRYPKAFTIVKTRMGA